MHAVSCCPSTYSLLLLWGDWLCVQFDRRRHTLSSDEDDD